LSVREVDKPRAVMVARDLSELGFELFATKGTAAAIRDAGIACVKVDKVNEGRPHVVDMIKNEEFDLVVNTTEGKQAIEDSAEIRRRVLQMKVYHTTTISGAEATCMALKQQRSVQVRRLQDLHG